MIRSMTGFGQANRSIDGYTVNIELKSINHRYCEIVVRMPKEWNSYEEALKKALLRSIKRGRVDVFVSIEQETDTEQIVSIDWGLVEGYLQAAVQLKQRYHFTENLTLLDILKLPDLIQLKEDRAEPNEALKNAIMDCVDDALAQLIRMRENEGTFLSEDLLQRLKVMESSHRDLQLLAPQVVEEYASKLRIRINELLWEHAPADEQRLAMEVALFADRSNVDEELTRLQSHFKQFRKLLQSDEPVGRKLDFLIQEMNREVNTIGSKASHSEFAVKVIEMKAELEKMREQIQNIE